MLALLAAAPVRADALKLSGSWITEVTLEKVEGGKVIYTTRAGTETERDLKDVQGVMLTAYPELEAAAKAMDANKPADAVDGFRKVAGAAREGWVKQWATAQLYVAYDKLGKPIEATDAYLALVRDNADPLYTAKPPIKTLAAASPAQRKDLTKKINDVVKASSASPALGNLKKMLEQLAVLEQQDVAGGAASSAGPTAAATPTGTLAPTPDAGGKPMASPTAAPSGTPVAGGSPAPTATPPSPGGAKPVARAAGPTIAIQRSPDGSDADDPVITMLTNGEYQKALDAANDILQKPNNEMSLRLYHAGVAQIALADARKDPKLYLDAGLNLMRVIIHFPKSASVGGALVEAGYVHIKINRLDLARKLLERADLYIDEEKDPAVFARLASLKAQVAGK